MVVWDRQTPWRQGHLLTDETSVALGLLTSAQANEAAIIVISHDCDLTQQIDLEPTVEVIVGRRVAKPDGNFTHAKNPRRLHLAAQENAKQIWLDLVATNKRLICKENLAAYNPNYMVSLSPTERSILQRWLAARYRRSAFPDEFDRRLKETGLRDRLVKIIEPLGTHLIAIFFDVDEGQEIERRTTQDTYTLRIYLLYSTEFDPAAAEKAIENAAAAIENAFRECCFVVKNGAWQQIELVECQQIADEALTYAMSVKLKKWNADYISLRTAPPQPLLQE